ncbi:MarR family winged helix-turn-helix transcriptional regulator [Rhizobium sp. BE258]|uniref:MarR family winged helix-turn-helix transcriptional regulator n=1 Tax=Rhizobium sp. BE258 TaxID=2817722 RepID=UPI0013AF1C70|nr:MarR family winged helix-turn-helix transcriptional regulator [Rhizobium sp. BE258]MDR7145014.1 DNA-binding MarR family transcriptional regulator [Rhizobium sp. BE258]
MTTKKNESKRKLPTELCYSLATRQFSRLLGRVYHKHMHPCGISAGDFAILEFLSQCGEMTMVDLARRLVMDRTTLVRTLKPLQDEGYVVAQPDPVEPRRLNIVLTAGGETKRREATPLWEAAQEEVERMIGKTQASALRVSIGSAVHEGKETA